MKVSFSPAGPRTKARFHWARHHWRKNKHQQNLLCSWLSMLGSCEHELRRRLGRDKEGHIDYYSFTIAVTLAYASVAREIAEHFTYFCSASSWPKTLSPPTSFSLSLFFLVVSPSVTKTVTCIAKHNFSFHSVKTQTGFSVSDWLLSYYKQCQSFLKNYHVSS